MNKLKIIKKLFFIITFIGILLISSNKLNSYGFEKYKLSSDELLQIASLCRQEQGTAKGAAAEASLMANLYEERGSKYGSLYSYVRNSGWFANAARFMDARQASSDIVKAVKSVLVDGKRTIPGYINEHDCLSDISSATNNGKPIRVSNKSAYKQHVTYIRNVNRSKYYFYSFPAEGSDPFGYTSQDRRKEIGEAYYDFDTGEAMNGASSGGTLASIIFRERKLGYQKGTNKSNNTSVDATISEADEFVGKADTNKIDQVKLSNSVKNLYYILIAIAIVFAIIVGTYLSIKLITSSTKEKAVAKQNFIAYVIGCTVAFGAFGIWRILMSVMNVM